MSEEKPDRLLIPIEGLSFAEYWSVGRVIFHPGECIEALMLDAPPPSVNGEAFSQKLMDETVAAAKAGCVAEVALTAGGIDDALDAVRSALDVLRLWQRSRVMVRPTAFGLPDETRWARITYLVVGSRNAVGWTFKGEPIGWTFAHEELDSFSTSEAFQFLSAALADDSPSEGVCRAILGAQLLARACTEHRPDLKMLGVVTALEAWLLRRDRHSQTYRLARAGAWFGCGLQDQNLCGRHRPICPYLHLSPDKGKDRKRLCVLRDLGNTYPQWRCSEWHQVVDWYDTHSDTAHGGDPTDVAKEDASEAEFWVTHYLMRPILEWLLTHPDDPVGGLENTLKAIADPGGWKAMLDALDAPDPPESPPPL